MDTPSASLTKPELVSMIIEFEREYQLWAGVHTPGDLQAMDAEHLEKIRSLYAEAIDICMIERRRGAAGREDQ